MWINLTYLIWCWNNSIEIWLLVTCMECANHAQKQIMIDNCDKRGSDSKCIEGVEQRFLDMNMHQVFGYYNWSDQSKGRKMLAVMIRRKQAMNHGFIASSNNWIRKYRTIFVWSLYLLLYLSSFIGIKWYLSFENIISMWCKFVVNI